MHNTARVATLALTLSAFASEVQAQVSSATIADLASAEDTVRIRAFYQILNLSGDVTASGSIQPRTQSVASAARRDDGIARGLIGLLEREVEIGWTARPGVHAESFSNYFGDLIGAVAALRDPRAIDVLLSVIHTGRMATDGLIALGSAAVGPVARLLDSSNAHHRLSAARTLGGLAERRGAGSLSMAELQVVRARLLAAAADNDPHVRRFAIDGLVSFRDGEVRAVMKSIAQGDPYSVTQMGSPRYPVREAAESWLRGR